MRTTHVNCLCYFKSRVQDITNLIQKHQIKSNVLTQYQLSRDELIFFDTELYFIASIITLRTSKCAESDECNKKNDRTFILKRDSGKMLVVYKTEYDAKSRGRSVQIRFHRKVISQKSKKDAGAKLYYVNGGMKN